MLAELNTICHKYGSIDKSKILKTIFMAIRTHKLTVFLLCFPNILLLLNTTSYT
jgi:hypothetical protein